MNIKNKYLDKLQKLIKKFNENEEIAHAEVGLIIKNKSIVSTTGSEFERSTNVSDSGIWCRVFVDGAAAYKYTTDFGRVDEIARLARKRADLLAQSATAQYDPITSITGSHEGWAINNRNNEKNINDKINIIREAIENVGIDDTIRVYYEDISRDDVIITTNGDEIRNSIDRNWVDVRSSISRDQGDSIKIRNNSGNTLGFEDGGKEIISDSLKHVKEQKNRIQNHAAGATSGKKVCVLSGSVAALLFYMLSRYLEMDMIYFGSSPFDVGDKIASELVNINDIIKPGSWSAIGFDAEGRLPIPTRLVSDGVIKHRIHSTTTGLEENEQPRGNFILPLNPESPPRIHPRHIDVKPGSTSVTDLLKDAEVYIESVGKPEFENEATSTKQSSHMPPSALYAKDIANQTPAEYASEPTDQSILLPIVEGYTIVNGKKEKLLTGGNLSIKLNDFKQISGLGLEKSTKIGKNMKNNSQLPFSSSSPPIRLEIEVST